MIEFRAHYSSSAANLYDVRDGDARMALECGTRYQDMQVALGHRVTQLDAVLLTHHHGDHSRCVDRVLKAGVDVYASEATWGELGQAGGHHRARRIEAGELAVIGHERRPWHVVAFETVHDAEGGLGFVIAGPSGDKLLFAVDTAYLKHRFAGLTHVAVECNWSGNSIRRALDSGRVPASHVARVVRHHLSLRRVIKMLEANDLSEVREIHLLHLSDGHSDEREFKAAVQRVTGKPVHVAPRAPTTTTAAGEVPPHTALN